MESSASCWLMGPFWSLVRAGGSVLGKSRSEDCGQGIEKLQDLKLKNRDSSTDSTRSELLIAASQLMGDYFSAVVLHRL